MRLKSTGLGATELFGDLTSMEKSMSGVLMKVKIKKPAVWRVRVFLNPQDLRAIVRRALLPQNVWFVIKTVAGEMGLFKRKNMTINKSYKRLKEILSQAGKSVRIRILACQHSSRCG